MVHLLLVQDEASVEVTLDSTTKNYSGVLNVRVGHESCTRVKVPQDVSTRLTQQTSVARVVVAINGKDAGPVEPDRAIIIMYSVVTFGVFPRNIDLFRVRGRRLFNHNFGV